ncbi:MAG: hypothetical protein AAFW00_19700 [Bacteroidota bacterium]
MYKIEHWLISKERNGRPVYHLVLLVRLDTQKEAEAMFEAIKKTGEASKGFNCETELFVGPRRIDSHKFQGTTLK